MTERKGTERSILASQACSSTLRRETLLKLKLKALRTRAWFRALNRIDRVLFNLVIKVAKNVRNPALVKAVSSVVQKLEASFNVRMSIALLNVGFRLAQKLSKLAESLGNKLAGAWASDLSFAKFLAVMHLNDPRRSKT